MLKVTEEMRETLVRIKEEAEVALGVAELEGVGGLDIDWYDLACVDAQWVVSAVTPPFYEVSIETGEQDAHEVLKYVETTLELAGWGRVCVVGDWDGN